MSVYLYLTVLTVKSLLVNIMVKDCHTEYEQASRNNFPLLIFLIDNENCCFLILLQ